MSFSKTRERLRVLDTIKIVDLKSKGTSKMKMIRLSPIQIDPKVLSLSMIQVSACRQIQHSVSPFVQRNLAKYIIIDFLFLSRLHSPKNVKNIKC